MTFQRFYYCLFIVNLILILISATKASEAYPLSVAAPNQETIAGHIKDIDRATGVITVETATGVVKLEAAPEAIAGWKEGDPVVVKIDGAEQREHGNVTEQSSSLLQSSRPAQSGVVMPH